jgi:hypothetical protein
MRLDHRAPAAGSCQLLLQHRRRCGAVDWSEIRLDAEANDAGQAFDSGTGELQDAACAAIDEDARATTNAGLD